MLALALFVFVLAFAAKHGQFEPESEHAHFLAQAVKMDKEAHRLPDGLAGVPPQIVVTVGPVVAVQEAVCPLPAASSSTASHQRTLPLLI